MDDHLEDREIGDVPRRTREGRRIADRVTPTHLRPTPRGKTRGRRRQRSASRR